jgi:outer membrane protein TolC
VVSAFLNVGDSLHAIVTDSDALEAAPKSERTAARALAIARRQLDLGDISETVLLNAEALHAQALLALVQARANRLSDCVALFQALGGGWWNRLETPGARDEEPRAAAVR